MVIQSFQQTPFFKEEVFFLDSHCSDDTNLFHLRPTPRILFRDKKKKKFIQKIFLKRSTHLELYKPPSVRLRDRRHPNYHIHLPPTLTGNSLTKDTWLMKSYANDRSELHSNRFTDVKSNATTRRKPTLLLFEKAYVRVYLRRNTNSYAYTAVESRDELSNHFCITSEEKV